MKRYIHSIGAVLAVALVSLSQLEGILPGPKLKALSAGLAVLVALLTQIDRILPGPPAAAIVLVLVFGGCPHPGPGPVTPGGVISCGAEAVQSCAPSALPAVNECLAGTSNVTSCLLGLIQPVGCITREVIACLVQHEGGAAEHASKANPADKRDARIAVRAREYLEGQGVKFAP